jgi:hypothetical protein
MEMRQFQQLFRLFTAAFPFDNPLFAIDFGKNFDAPARVRGYIG